MPETISTIPVVPRSVSLPRIMQLARDPIHTFSWYAARYGPSFYLNIGAARRSLITTDPDIIQHVLQRQHRRYEKSEIQSDQLANYLGRGLLTNTGSDWLRQRRLIQPGFHRDRLQGLTALMQAVTGQQLEIIARRATEAPTGLDIYPLMLETAFRIIARTLFTEPLSEAQLRELSKRITRIQEFIIWPVRLPPLRPLLRLSGVQGHFERMARRLDRQMLDLIDRRRRGGQQRDDLLQMLLDARYEDTGEPMDDRRLVDELVILFVAGHETSANALTWTLHLLSQHPRAQERAREEVQAVAGDDLPDFARLRQLTYLTQVIEESMRLYPPAWITDRVALQDDRAGQVFIPQGMVVAPFIYGLHHHAGLWDNPQEFRPERFSAEARRERHPYAYVPFGGGPRLCIGNNFAMMELQMVIAGLLQRFRFEPVPGARIEAKALVTLRPRKGVPLRIFPAF